MAVMVALEVVELALLGKLAIQTINAQVLAQVSALLDKKDVLEAICKHAVIIILIPAMNGVETLIALMDARIISAIHALHPLVLLWESNAEAGVMDVLEHSIAQLALLEKLAMQMDNVLVLSAARNQIVEVMVILEVIFVNQEMFIKII